MIQKLLVSGAITLAAAMPAAAQRSRSPSIQPAPPAPAPCTQFYLGGRAPVTVAPAPADHRPFCRSFYALTYSTRLRNPVWTSYRLTRDMVRGADAIGRHSRRFRPQVGLLPTEQAHHDDYDTSRFDRGHMTPDNDAPDRATQADTYVVSNIVPQISGFNGGLWAGLERSVHRLARNEGEVFIVTGPVFANSRPATNGIAEPSDVFKAIFVPSRGFALAFISSNAHPTRCRIVAIAEVERATGLDVFPSLPAATKAQLPTLPRRWGRFPRHCRAGP